jgi:hypothetical protein
MTGPAGRLGALFSYHGAGTSVHRRAAQAADAGIPVVWDSGAWSVFSSGATVDVDDHARWVAANQGRPQVRHVGLDVIGDRHASVANFRRQRSLGAHVEPTVHYGEPLDALDTYLDDNPSGWVNAGGIVPLSRGNGPRKAAAFLAAVVRRLDGRARTHALGATHPDMAGPVPFDACDSTYWMSATRYGLLPLFDPERGDWRKFQFKSRHPQARSHGWGRLHIDGRWLRSEYGVSPADLDRAADIDVVALSVESHRRYADWLSQRHGREVTVYLAGAEQIIDHLIGALR